MFFEWYGRTRPDCTGQRRNDRVLFGKPPIRRPQRARVPDVNQRVSIILRVVYRFDEINEWYAIFRFAWNKPRRSHTPPSLSPARPLPLPRIYVDYSYNAGPGERTVFMREPLRDYLLPANVFRRICPRGHTSLVHVFNYTSRCVDRRTRFIYGTGDGLEQRRRRRGLAILVRMNTVVVIRVTYGNARADGQLRGYTCVVDDLEIRVCSVNC